MRKTKDIVGEVLNDTYRLTRKLDQGGMGAVYEAVHARLKRKRFAIKVLRPEAAEAKELFARFRREAEITSELGHPHIVNVIDFHETADGRQYMVMEFLDGENLGQRLRTRGPLPPRELHRLMEQVGSGLQAAHDKGIVHRDMKPENIFLVDTGTDKPLAKVLDFGISKIRHSASVLTRDHSLLGSPFYMSPEQASGLVKTIDHYTDIFALGSIGYHALTGKLPFDGPTLQGVIYQVVHHQQDPVTRHNTRLPEVFDRVISKAMAKKKEDRYDSVSEFVEALGHAVHGEQVEEDEPLNVEAIGLATTAISVSTGPPAPTKKALDDDLATGETVLGPSREDRAPAPARVTGPLPADTGDRGGAYPSYGRTPGATGATASLSGRASPTAGQARRATHGIAADRTGMSGHAGDRSGEPAEIHGGEDPSTDLRLSTYSSATGERPLGGDSLYQSLSQSSRWPLFAGGVVVLLLGIIAALILRDPGTGTRTVVTPSKAPPPGARPGSAPAGEPAPAPAPVAKPAPAAVAPVTPPGEETPARADLKPDAGAAPAPETRAARKRKRRPGKRKGRASKKPKPAPVAKVEPPAPKVVPAPKVEPTPKPTPKPKAVARKKPQPKKKPPPKKKPLGESLMDMKE